MFIEIPATNQSIAQRKPIQGVGINDANYMVCPTINGKKVECKIYDTWTKMILRCYDPYYINSRLRYENCYVCDEWLHFSKFKLWMESQDWKGQALDKDIINPDSGLYSPEFCAFVPIQINNIITDSFSSRGEFPIGVTRKRSGKGYRYCARTQEYGKPIVVGMFGSVREASEAYNISKHNHLIEVSKAQTDERIKKGLIIHAKMYLNGDVL